ncbi:hypothetical protein SADUNF_Sadunf09G0010300 [Salix dunnii]|uniref:Uncharacterized protein n=1 Tax=Salix dunnii TaxID=1413687 RepID=A0A835JV75_9ROSI|nr:hypothetical protein SADUNF_Sadunf09G0010300 [Salix dunnii]
MEGTPQVPDVFYCEIYRLSRADLFWFTVAHPLYPVKLVATIVPTDGYTSQALYYGAIFNSIVYLETYLHVNATKQEHYVVIFLWKEMLGNLKWSLQEGVEKTFHLARADKDLLAKQEYNVQSWCMLLNDKVPFRMQWPQHTDLQVNGIAICAINRPGSQLLGANGRDDGPIITLCAKDGINKLSLTGCDARIFCLGVRIVKRRTVQQVILMIFNKIILNHLSLNLISLESEGERFEDALARVCCCVGGTATDNAYSDSDLEVVADSFGVNLRCPMRHCVEDITEIEVKPDGSWQLSVSDTGELKSKVEMVKQIKQEGGSEGASLKLGIRKNRNGFWEVSKPEDMNTSSGQLQENFEHHEHKVIPMSSSATGSGCDGEDPSVNQDTGGNFEITNNGMEHDSLSLNIHSMCGVTDQNSSAPVGNAEVIVLSGSDEENDILISSGSVYKSNQNGATFSVPSPEIADHFLEDPAPGTGGNSSLGLFNADDEYGMPLWPLLPGNQAGPGFQLFNSDVSDALVDISHGPVNCPFSMNSYTLTPETVMRPACLIPYSSIGRSDMDVNDGLVDNPLFFGREDPSLQIFLPTGPSDASMQSDVRDQADVSNGVRTDDWISLSLGGDATGNHGESVPSTNVLNSRQPMQSREDGMDSLAGTVLCSFHIHFLCFDVHLLIFSTLIIPTSTDSSLGINDDRTLKASRQRSDSPFSFPRQKRSVRQRSYLSNDLDSE